MKLDAINMTIIAMVRQSRHRGPSCEEIAGAIDRAPSVTKARVRWLVEKGYLEKIPRASRTLTATQKGREVFPEFVLVKEREGTIFPYQGSWPE